MPFTAAQADALFSARWGRLKDSERGRSKARREPRRRDAAVKAPRPAAGILFRVTDADGAWYLLGKRSRRLGGTWANIGGSLEPGETALVGALREVHEEIQVAAASLPGTLAAEVQCGTDAKPYTLFLVDLTDTFHDAVLGWENDDLAWWHEDEVTTLDLHDGFRRGWEALA